MKHGYSSKTAEIWDYFFDDQEAFYDVNLYTSVVNKQADTAGKTLDIGCGTGRFAIPLAQKGYSVTGIDTCESMLSIFENKLHDLQIKPELMHVGFEDFAFTETYDGIVAQFVLQFILESDDVIDFFKKVNSILNDDGVFFISAFNSLGLWNPKGWSATHTRELDMGFARGEYSFTPVDTIKGVANAADYRVLSTPDGDAVDYYTKQVRFYTLTEYKLMLSAAGFGDISVYTDFNPAPTTDETCNAFKFHIVARK